MTTTRSRSAIRVAGCLGLIVSALLTLPGSALGQDDDPGVAEARRLFDEAQVHFEAGRFEAAAEAFQRTYELMREADHPNAPIILYNLGTSLDEIPGREADARDAYVRFLAEGDPTHEVLRERGVQVQARIRGLDQGLASSAASSAESSGGPSPVGPVLLGVGGAALVTGGILFGVVVGNNDSLLPMCAGGVCPTASRAAADNVHTLAIGTDVLVIGGVLIAATGLVLTVALQEGGAGDTTMAAACMPGGCLAVLGGTF